MEDVRRITISATKAVRRLREIRWPPEAADSTSFVTAAPGHLPLKGKAE